MNQTDIHGTPSQLDPRSMFAARPPSTSWEAISFGDSTQNHVWAWYKPASIPQGLMLQIPDEIWANDPAFAAQLTMRRLLSAAGIDPCCITTWYLQGAPFDSMNGTNPLLDQPVPAPVPGADPNIVVYVNPQDDRYSKEVHR